MKSKPIKIIGSAMAAIFLGAVGSGVWSGLLSPLWNVFVVSLVRLFARFSGSLTDSIYINAAKGFHEAHSLSVLSLLLGLLAGAYVTLISVRVLARFGNRKDAMRRFVHSIYGSLLFYILMPMVVMMCISINLYSAYSNKVTTGALTSIDIVAPYIGPVETMRLKSQFYQIKSRKDYSIFYLHLKSFEGKHGVALPLTDPL